MDFRRRKLMTAVVGGTFRIADVFSSTALRAVKTTVLNGSDSSATAKQYLTREPTTQITIVYNGILPIRPRNDMWNANLVTTGHTKKSSPKGDAKKKYVHTKRDGTNRVHKKRTSSISYDVPVCGTEVLARLKNQHTRAVANEWAAGWCTIETCTGN